RGRHLAGGQPRLRPDDACVCVDLDRVQTREVEHDAAVGDAVPGRAVAAAPNGELQARLARESNDVRDLVGVDRADDGRRPAVEGREEDLAGLFVVGVVRSDDGPGDAGPEPGEQERRVRKRGHELSSVVEITPTSVAAARPAPQYGAQAFAGAA